MSHLLEISGAYKSFGKKKVLENIAFELKIGEILGIFGRNGSGKSSLLKMIFGTLPANHIQIKFDSEIIEPKEIIPRQLIGYLPQDSFLPKSTKVRDIIPLFCDDEEKQNKVFYAQGVSKFDHTQIGKLSMGQLRYLETLLVGSLDHPFIMLDEPFSMLEPLYKELLKELLQNLSQTKGIIVTDHYYRDVLDITHSNFLLKNGNKIEILEPMDLVNNGYIPSH
ncbi:ABC-type multidrug transport system ATPase subunit [Gillisia sp. Hel_I_86]|uniref:ATP-binding cassette domain-containing protein n=1 Tax=Gillisia sp. Hel_I_86 TaxID=1249981 RepID=UPI001199F352|nr:ATP-binding cassette domain-containing protein [Gillisia sp. Hel_I_86]TVZ25340.1 ABC-type multidrug transport system ATPase subunit [Gillisia sp. Hel_I_86]